MRGSYGLAILFRDFPGQHLLPCRKESPLIVGYGAGENFLATDIPGAAALHPRVQRCWRRARSQRSTERGQDPTSTTRSASRWQKQRLTADWDIGSRRKGRLSLTFMLKEIHEQPRGPGAPPSIRAYRTACPRCACPELTDEYLAGVEHIHIVACGTAMHAGMVGKTAIERIARVPVYVDIASEFRYRDPVLGKNDLVVIISQSGETLDTLAALKLARERGAKTLAVVNVVGSSIARAADWVLTPTPGRRSPSPAPRRTACRWPCCICSRCVWRWSAAHRTNASCAT